MNNKKTKKIKDLNYEEEWRINHEEQVLRWTVAISELVNFARGSMSIASLAERMHYSRSTLNALLNQDSLPLRRYWTLDNLLAAADALGCDLPSLLKVASERVQNPGAPYTIASLKTEPCSKERLQRLIHLAAEFDPVRDEREFDGLLGLEYQVSRFEFSSPDFCRAYYEGKLSDKEALAFLTEAENIEHPKGEEPPPLWAKLMKVYTK